ncbi:hypothetical protein R1flu_028811 [Riccia fluitans]|uniref:Uncharacterized protein n=1 Tax=Riccia fluitans TaxID=41844 RepID=A0ABD1XMQ7_9MARC
MKFSKLLTLVAIFLLSSSHLLVQPAYARHGDHTWKLYFNNLSSKSLTIKICTVPGCVHKSPVRYEDFRPFSVEVLVGSDDWPKTVMSIKDTASGRKLSRDLWNVGLYMYMYATQRYHSTEGRATRSQE